MDTYAPKTGGIVCKIRHQITDLEDAVKVMKKEIAGFSRRMRGTNKFVIKVMHAFAVALCLMQERITVVKPCADEDCKDLIEFLKKKWALTLLSKRLGGNS